MNRVLVKDQRGQPYHRSFAPRMGVPLKRIQVYTECQLMAQVPPGKIRLYKFLSENKPSRINAILRNNEVHCDRYANFNDLLEGNRFDSSNVIGGVAAWLPIQDSLRVSCFTEDPLTMLLWSYYTQGFRGVCVAIDIPDSYLTSSGDVRLVKVEYLPNVSFTPLPPNPTEAAFDSLTRKFDIWKHEREYRIIAKESALKNGAFFADMQCVAIACGSRMDPIRVQRLRKLGNQLGIRYELVLPNANDPRVIITPPYTVVPKP